MEELDFIQPKKVVGEMISMSVIDDIKIEIKNEIDKCHSNGKYSYDNSRIGLRKALEIIDKHIKVQNNDKTNQGA